MEATIAEAVRFWLLLGPSGSMCFAPSGWRGMQAVGRGITMGVRVCGADRAVELVESVKLVEHTTCSGDVQYGVVRVLHGL